MVLLMEFLRKCTRGCSLLFRRRRRSQPTSSPPADPTPTATDLCVPLASVKETQERVSSLARSPVAERTPALPSTEQAVSSLRDDRERGSPTPVAASTSSPFGKPSGSLAETDSGYVASSGVLAPSHSCPMAPKKKWIVFSNPYPYPSSPGPVLLERIGLHGNRIVGRVSVANLAYEKDVYVHWTFDRVMYSDTNCRYDCSESPQRDIFEFDLPATASFELSVGYNVAGQSFSDDNSGAGYRVLL